MCSFEIWHRSLVQFVSNQRSITNSFYCSKTINLVLSLSLFVNQLIILFSESGQTHSFSKSCVLTAAELNLSWWQKCRDVYLILFLLTEWDKQQRWSNEPKTGQWLNKHPGSSKANMKHSWYNATSKEGEKKGNRNIKHLYHHHHHHINVPTFQDKLQSSQRHHQISSGKL